MSTSNIEVASNERTVARLRMGTADAKRLMEALVVLESKIEDCKHLRPDTAGAALSAREFLVAAIKDSLDA